jgi:opacity protein-like surface antigen/ketosteroid isomerase-like protein
MENIMNKIFMLTVVMVLMAIVTAAQAEVKAGSFSVTPFIGGYIFEGNENLKDSYTVGLRAGYNFTKYFGVEGFFNYIPTEIQNVPDEPWQNVYGYGVEGILHLMPEGRIVPFLAIGIGGIHYSYPEEYRTNKFAVDYGAGLKIFITDDIALRADVRHVIPFNERYNDLLVTFGICFSFGGERKQMASARVEEPAVEKEAVATAPEPAVAKVEEQPAPKAAEIKVEEHAAPQETVVPPKVEEPVAPVPAPVPTPAPVPAVTESPAPISGDQDKTKPAPEEDVQNLINKWLASWQSGDMQTYRSCYMPDFQSKGMDLNAWITYKTNVRQRSKDINIRIENLKISADEKTSLATAIFTQYYSSSVLNDTVKKSLSLKKIDEGWKIYRETIVPHE